MKEDRRPEILEATCRVIARVGIHDLYIRHVAEEAGVSRALVSYYFPTRADLLAAALAYAEVRAIHEIGDRTGKGAAIERIVETLLLEIDDSPAVRDNWIIWSEMTETAFFDDSFRPSMSLWSQRWIDNLASMIREGQEEGAVGSGIDAVAAAERLTALVDGIGLRWLLGHTSRDRAHQLLKGAVASELKV